MVLIEKDLMNHDVHVLHVLCQQMLAQYRTMGRRGLLYIHSIQTNIFHLFARVVFDQR